MRSNLIEESKKALRLTQEQRDIIVGLVLGDGHLETQNHGRTYRLKVEHSVKQQAYLEWIQTIFREWIRPRELHLRLKDGRPFSVSFSTLSHGSFRFYGQQFYEGRKKVIPKMLAKTLSPLSIAVWFMDDGSLKSKRHATYIIHTLGYTLEDLRIVQSVLLEKFQIETRLHRQKGKYWRLYIPQVSARKFRDTIEPFLHPSMRYKLGTHMPKK